MGERITFHRRFFNFLVEAYRNSFNGTIIGKKGETIKSVSIMFGKVISASSNAKIDRLELWFYKKKFLSKEEIAKFSKIAREKRISFWKTIVLSKRFNDEQLKGLIKERINEILFDLFSWTEGHLIYKEGEYPGGELPNMDIDVVEATKATLCRLSAEEHIAYLKGKGKMIIGKDKEAVELDEDEKKIMDKLNSSYEIDKLATIFPPCRITFLYVFSAIEIFKGKTVEEMPTEEEPPEGSMLESEPMSSVKEARKIFNIGMEKYRYGDYKSALEMFKEASRSDPSVSEYFTALGLTYATDWDKHPADIKKAAAAFRKAIEIDPKNPRNYFYLGEILKFINREEQAIKYFKKAVEIDPSYTPAREELEKFIG